MLAAICRCLTTAALLLAADAAWSQAPVAPQAFEALSEGHTLHFSLEGRPYGAEQYFAGRRVLWQFADGRCDTGTWFADDAAICFSYTRDPEPRCWHFRDDGSGRSARLLEAGVETGFAIELNRIDDLPLTCPGPEVGT